MSFALPFRPLIKGWVLSFIGWGLVAFVMAAHGVATRGDSWSEHLAPGLRDWLPWAIFTPILFRLVSRMPIDRQHWRLAVPIHLVSCAAVILTCHWWRDTLGSRNPGRPPIPKAIARERPDGGPGWDRIGEPPPRRRLLPGREGNPSERPFGPPPGFDVEDMRPPRPERLHAGPHPGLPGRPSPPGLGFGLPPHPRPGGSLDMFRLMSFELPICLMIITSAHAALFFRREQERAASLARARLEALKMQLQPHFLFNTLNTIAGLVHEEPDKADAMLTALSELLRLTLETSSQMELPLSREMEFVERYLAIMNARFEERLRFEIDFDSGTRNALVPTFLLQPIVENAVEHGLQPKPEGGYIVVRTWREGMMLHLSVTDNGVGVPKDRPHHEGIGLGNTRARLRELYGDRAQLQIRTNGETTVEITLPFHTADQV